MVFVPNEEGKGGTVEITGEVDDSTVEAITLAAPAKEREDVAATIERHQIASKAVKAPSQNGAVFSVPRLCVMEQGELEFIESGAVPPGFTWDLLAYPPDLSSLKFNADSQTFDRDEDALRLYAKWLESKSDRLFQRLVGKGLVPGFGLHSTALN